MKLPINFDEPTGEIPPSTFSTAEKSRAGEYLPAAANFKISVIVPSYNRAELVAQTVRSVLAQSLEGFELIVVDDGSTDETAERLTEFGGLPNFRYFYQTNNGRSSARNRGMECARGEYLMFLDSDDLLAPDALDNLWRAAQKFPASGVVAGRRANINGRGEFLSEDDYNRMDAFADRDVHYEKFGVFFCVWAATLSKKIWRRG